MKAFDDVADELQACVTRFVNDHRLPGASVGVVTPAGLVWSSNVGVADVSRATPSTSSTLYAIASISKTFTGTAIMQLEERGLLSLDDPLTTYLPEMRDADESIAPIAAVTLRRMLSHESGMAEEPAGTDWALEVREGVVAKALERVGEIGVRVAPHSQWKYSNLAYELLGEVVARASAVPFDQYVQHEILDPLEMTSTGFRPLSPHLDARRATGYRPRAFSDEFVVANEGPLSWGEAGLWSTVDDLARWLCFQLGAYGVPEIQSPVLKAATLKAMHKPRYLVDEQWTRAWGISWYAARRDDAIWIQHSGGWYGFITDACFDPVTKVGAIALLNGIGDAPSLAMELGAIARRSLSTAAPALRSPTRTPDQYRSLLGAYFDTEYAEIVRVEWRDGELVIVNPSTPSWKATLVAGETADSFIVGPGIRPSGERVVFNRRGDGRVVSMFFAVGTFERLDTLD